MIAQNIFKQFIYKQPRVSLSVKQLFNSSTVKERQRYFVVEYNYTEDQYYKRIPYREEHDKLVQKFENRGNQIVGGTYFPLTGASMIFNCDELRIVEDFVKNDVYNKQGLVQDYKITEIERKTKDELQEISKIFGYR